MAIGDNVDAGFEKNLWSAACVLWGHIPAADYRKVIIGLIFLRYISYAFEKRFNELVAEGDGFENDPDAYAEENVFFVPENARWKKIAVAAHTPEIGTVIDNAMREIEVNNKKLKNVLPKNYSNPDLDKRVLGEVVDMFTNIKMSDSDSSKDLLGRTYEYCIAQFAAYEGVKGGEFYTPSSIVKIIVSVLRPFSNCRVYDPCCGSGGMFIQSEKFIQAHSGKRGTISIFGQESNADTWKMAKMNLAIRGIDANLGEYHADTFFNDLHPTLKADFIMANPPFNLKDWGQDKLKDDKRWKYGLPPAGNANYAWIQHMLSHLAPNGKIGLVLANGALSIQTGGEGEIRKKIIEDDFIEGIVALPTQLFYSVTIPVTLWFISRNKKRKGKTLFVDARKMGFMVDRKHRDFSDDDIKKIADTFVEFQSGTLESVKGFCAVADLEDIKNQDYILTPGRYVGIEEQEDDGEIFDEKMKRLVEELSLMFSKSHELEYKIRKNLVAIGYAFHNLAKEDEARIIRLAEEHRVEKVVLFGSRARGTNKTNSDIDLAISGGGYLSFGFDFDDETGGNPKCDVSCLDHELKVDLRDSINKEGIVLYEDKMDYGRRYQAFSESLNSFDHMADSDCNWMVIKAFDTCFEQSWKLLKLLLESQGESFDVNVAPSVIIAVACRRGIIENELIWKKLLDTYNAGDDVKSNCCDISTRYLELFNDLKCRVDAMGVKDC